MTFYITPKDGSGRVISAETREGAALILEDLKAQGVTEVDFNRGDFVCDFCSTPNVRWRYEIKPGGSIEIVGAAEVHADADGVWGACPECKALIQQRGWSKLADRSFEVFIDENDSIGLTSDFVRAAIQTTQSIFRIGWLLIDAPDPLPVMTDSEFLLQHGIES